MQKRGRGIRSRKVETISEREIGVRGQKDDDVCWVIIKNTSTDQDV